MYPARRRAFPSAGRQGFSAGRDRRPASGNGGGLGSRGLGTGGHGCPTGSDSHRAGDWIGLGAAGSAAATGKGDDAGQGGAGRQQHANGNRFHRHLLARRTERFSEHRQDAAKPDTDQRNDR